MKIVIAGPGAIGCLLAASFTKSKNSVVVLDKYKERADRLNRNGFSVDGIQGLNHVSIPVSHDAKNIGPADLVVLCVKAYSTQETLNSLHPLITNSTKILTLQNGIGNAEIISEVFGQDRVIAGVTNLGATLIGEGKVVFAGKGETVVGMLDGRIPVELRIIRELLAKIGSETKATRDIKGVLWSKLVINVGINALSALTYLPNGKLVEFEGTRKILRDAVAEATKIAKRKRIKLIYDDPLAKVESVCKSTAGNLSSMLQDVLAHKRTEIDFLNGVIVRFGQELGINVPVNSLLCDLIKTIESSYNQVVKIPST